MEGGRRKDWLVLPDTLNKIVSDMNDKTTGKSKAGEMLGKIWGNSVGAAGNYVEGVNDAFEQAVRLGAYIEARRAGASKQGGAALEEHHRKLQQVWRGHLVYQRLVPLLQRSCAGVCLDSEEATRLRLRYLRDRAVGNAGGSEDGCLPDDAVVCTDGDQHSLWKR